MAITIPRGVSSEKDEILRDLLVPLEQYQKASPRARIDIYRKGEYTIYIRVIDDAFAGKRLGDRHQMVWQYLEPLPEHVIGDIHILLCLTPKEVPDSLANMDFENPVPLEPALC